MYTKNVNTGTALSHAQKNAVDLYIVDGRVSSDSSSQKRESHQLLHDILSTGRSLLGVSFITRLKSNLCTSITTQNTTRNNYVITHTQNTTAFQPSLFFKLENLGYWSHAGVSPLASTNCQGQPQTPQSVSVGPPEGSALPIQSRLLDTILCKVHLPPFCLPRDQSLLSSDLIDS